MSDDTIKFTPIKLTGAENYAPWLTDIELVLTTKKVHYVTVKGAIPPTEAAAKRKWDEDDQMARALILCFVSSDMRADLYNDSNCKTARTLLDRLESEFQGNTYAHRLTLQLEFFSLKKEPSETIINYFGRAKLLLTKLKAAGAKLDDNDLACSLMNGLPDVYDNTIEPFKQRATSQTIDISELKALLIRREQEILMKDSSSDGVAMFSKYNRQRSDNNRPGQHAVNVQEQASQSDRPFCTNCKKKGHTRAECWGLKNQHSRQKGSTKNHRPHAQVALSDQVTTPVSDEGLTPAFSIYDPEPTLLAYSSPDSWIVDSGASRHITNNKDCLINVRELKTPISITYGNKQVASTSIIGDVALRPHSCSTNRDQDLHLRNVLYIPETHSNLISVSTLTADPEVRECKCLANAAHICMTDQSTIVAKKQHGVYILTGSHATEISETAFAATPTETPELWHQRYGHLGYNNLARIQQDDMVTGINITAQQFKKQQNLACDACMAGGQQRLPFPTSSSSSSAPLELVHMDLCGPFSQAAYPSKAKYMATILDDYTKLSVVIPIKHKYDLQDVIPQHLKELETQSGFKVKAVRTDNGKEYINEKLANYFKLHGIINQTTIPYTPQQNGAAERLNRTLLTKVRAMLTETHMPKFMWAHAAFTASDLRNRSPVTGLSKTPWELFYGKKPDVSMLRIWGSRAHVLVPSHNRSKLDPRSQTGRLVGYTHNSKGWIIWMDDLSIKASRDVWFEESSRTQSPSHPSLLPDQQLEYIEHSGDCVLIPTPTPTPMAAPSNSAPSVTTTSGVTRPIQEAAPAVPAALPPPPPLNTRPTRSIKPSSRYNTEDFDTSTKRSYTRHNASPDDEVRGDEPGNQQNTASLAIMDVPTTYAEAMSFPNAQDWKQATDEEMDSIFANDTFELRPTPSGIKPIPTKWVFTIKRDATGGLSRYKARWVAKGFKQQYGIDFTEVYAPVSSYTTLRALLAVVAYRDLELIQLDVKTAFLNGELEEDIYVQQPEGYEQGEGLSCYLKKALYGLKQAPRAWHQRLISELSTIGLTPSAADLSLFIMTYNNDKVYVLVYVDDILVAGYADAVKYVSDSLTAAFKVRNLGNAELFLGMNIIRDRSSRSLLLGQQRFITDLLTTYGMADCKPSTLPMSVNTNLSKTDGHLLDLTKYPYRSLVGSLQYLTHTTRPDISRTVGVLARYSNAPTTVHWQAAKTTLRYLAGTKNIGIKFGGIEEPPELSVTGYCDADYASDTDTRRSTTGYVYTLNGGAVTWNSKLQPTVATSTAESEYMAACAAVKEALWLRQLSEDLDISTCTIKINSDNQAAITLLKHPIDSQRSKHIDVRFHFAREHVARQEVKFVYISTEHMVADALTKAVPINKHRFCMTGMGMYMIK